MPKQPFTCSSTTPCRSLAHNHIHRPCRVDQNSLPTCASVFDDHTNNKTAWIHAYSAHRNTYVTLSSTNPASILMMFSEIWYGSAGKLCQLPCFWPHTCLPLVLATIHLLRCSCRVEHNALPTRASTWQNSKYFTRFGTSVIELRSSINSSTQGVRNYFLKLVSFNGSIFPTPGAERLLLFFLSLRCELFCSCLQVSVDWSCGVVSCWWHRVSLNPFRGSCPPIDLCIMHLGLVFLAVVEQVPASARPNNGTGCHRDRVWICIPRRASLQLCRWTWVANTVSRLRSFSEKIFPHRQCSRWLHLSILEMSCLWFCCSLSCTERVASWGKTFFRQLPCESVSWRCLKDLGCTGLTPRSANSVNSCCALFAFCCSVITRFFCKMSASPLLFCLFFCVWKLYVLIQQN